jgi:hypothetical protein
MRLRLRSMHTHMRSMRLRSMRLRLWFCVLCVCQYIYRTQTHMRYMRLRSMRLSVYASASPFYAHAYALYASAFYAAVGICVSVLCTRICVYMQTHMRYMRLRSKRLRLWFCVLCVCRLRTACVLLYCFTALLLSCFPALLVLCVCRLRTAIRYLIFPL